MDSHKIVWKETALVAACELIAAALTVAVYALLKKLDAGVWIGALVGALLATVNYFLLALAASKVTDSAAANGSDKAGQGMMRFSYILRLILIFAALVVLAKLKVINPLAAIVPLVLMQPIILFTQYYLQRKVK